MPLKLIDLSNMEFEAIDGLIPIQTKTPYCREENEGFYSLLGNDGINNYIMLNNTGYTILKACDGKRTVGNILQYLTECYPSAGEQNLKKDIITVFARLLPARVIGFRNDNSINDGRTALDTRASIGNNLEISLAMENDLPGITNFIETDRCLENINETVEYSWSTDAAEYCDSLAVRRRLFDYSRDYFIVLAEGGGRADIRGVIVVEPPSDILLHAAFIKYIKLPLSAAPAAIGEIANFYKAYPYRTITSLKIGVPESLEQKSNSLNRVIYNHFLLESTQIDDYGFDKPESLRTYRFKEW